MQREDTAADCGSFLAALTERLFWSLAHNLVSGLHRPLPAKLLLQSSYQVDHQVICNEISSIG